jgi:hypothetical protein
MKDFFEILFDKRFSLKFRILNILSGDYLRNYLACGVAMHINECVRILNDEEYSDKGKIALIKMHTSKAKKGMDDVWHI